MAPTLDVPVLFFLQTTELTLYIPYVLYVFFRTDFIEFRGTQRSWARVPASARKFFVYLQNRTRLKGPPVDFFRHCATFSKCLQRTPSFLHFLIFCNKLEFQKAQRVSPFYIFWHYETFKILIFRLKNIYTHKYFFQYPKF